MSEVVRVGRRWGCVERLLGICLGGLVGMQLSAGEAFWPAWRGPHGNGSSLTAKPPMEWSEEKNVAWKVAVPGKGHATPILWGNRVILSSAIPVGERREPVRNLAPGAHDNFPVDQTHRFVVTAFQLSDGRLLWETEVAREFPHEGGHFTGSLASHSPLTDGQRIYAFFGTRGLHALTMDGKQEWQRDFGRMETRHAHGEGSSPALHNEILIINWDHEKQSKIHALKADSGEEIWSVERDEMTSWSTPLIVPNENRYQVIVSATKRVRAYDLESGTLVWECSGLARNVVASPVYHNGLVIVGNSYDKQAMMAIRIRGAQGDVSRTDSVVWSLNRMTPYVPSPLVYDGVLYFLRHNQAVLSCLDPMTGDSIRGPYRLAGLREIFASPVAADARVYVAGRSGATLVFSHEPQPRALQVNRLSDRFSASPALSGKSLILRGEKFLYCLREP